MFLSDLSIKNPVMIIMVMIALSLFGVMAYFNTPLNLMPDAKIPVITIQTVYAGAAPEQVENLITKKIEDEISSLGLLSTISSYSLNSVSLITLAFDLDKDPDIASQEVKEKVDAIVNDLPADAEAPVVIKVDATAAAALTLVLNGDVTPAELNRIAETTVKESIARIPRCRKSQFGRRPGSGNQDCFQ